MTARWEEALDALLDLYVYSNSDAGRDYATGWAKSFTREGPDNHSLFSAIDPKIRDSLVLGGEVSREIPEFIATLPDRVNAFAFNADPIWIEPDMMSLWEAAMTDFEPEALLPTDILTDTGFVYLPRPLIVPDIHDARTSIRAIGWEQAEIMRPNLITRTLVPHRGLLVLTFHQLGDVDSYDNGSAVAVGKDDWKPYSYVRSRRGNLQIDHVMPWVYGQTASTKFKHVQGNVQSVTQSLWRLMQQTIATQIDWNASKPFRKRWMKQGLEPRRITVIRLRRPRSNARDGEEPRVVDWQGRWIVRGFWRWQWYPLEGAVCTHRLNDGSLCGKEGGHHRQIYINDYVKGPEDKPLIIRKTRVFEFVR